MEGSKRSTKRAIHPKKGPVLPGRLCVCQMCKSHMTPQKGYLSQRGTVLPGRLFVCLSTSSIEHDKVTLITSKVCKFVIQFLYTVLASHPFDPLNDHDKYNLGTFNHITQDEINICTTTKIHI